MTATGSTDRGSPRRSRTRTVGLVAAGLAVATSALAAIPELRAARDPWLFLVTTWPWLIAYGCAVLIWFAGTGAAPRFSLHNPPPRPPRPPRIPARIDGRSGLEGEGWVEFRDAGVRVTGWTVHRAFVPLVLVLVAAQLVRVFAWWGGQVSWLDVVLPVGTAWQLCRLRSIVDIAPGELVEATFLRGRVRLVRRTGEPLDLALRESRAAELANELDRIGCVIHAPAARPVARERPDDLDATLARLRATNDRLTAPPAG